MPGSRDIVANLDDKEAKKTKNPDVQQQAREEENAKQVSNLGNTSSSTEKSEEEEKAKEGSSTETETVSETEGSQDLMILKPSERKNIGLPIKKRLKLRQDDQTHKAESKSIDSSEACEKELQGEAATNQREDLSNKLFGADGREKTKPMRVKLFETTLTRTNRLVIPAETMENYLPPSEDDPMAEFPLQITDDIRTWDMTVVFYPEEDVFMVVKGWQNFSSWHSLEPFDLIQFHRPIPRLATNHYVITYERRRQVSAPEFTRENFLFRLELTSSDVGYRRLFIPSRDVAIHFPDVAIHFPAIPLPPLSKKKVIVRFTDITNKNWYMDVIRYNHNFYMVIDDWNCFVKAHDLRAGDVIKFYKPVQPSHTKHFLIACVKKESATTSNKKNGELSHRGSDKGKEIMEIG